MGGGLAAFGFGPDQIRTLVSMATDSSHRVIMGKTTLASSILIGSSLFLSNEDNHKILDEFEIGQYPTKYL